MLPPVILAAFPNLAADHPAITHPPDATYNCVAWAAGLVDAWWWPDDDAGYWPPGVPRTPTLEAVIGALATAGYVQCDGPDAEPGTEKAAIYAKGETVTHVARQLPGGRWSSKLGRSYTVSHATPVGVEGEVYGTVRAYLRRSAGFKAIKN